jgi:hypothetical protein
MIRRSSARMRVDDSGSAPDATATVCSGPASPVFFHRAKPVSRAGMLPSTTARSASGKYDGAGNDACRSAPHFNVTSLAPTRSSRYSVPHGAIGVFPYQAARGRLLEKFAVSRLTSVRLGFRRSRVHVTRRAVRRCHNGSIIRCCGDRDLEALKQGSTQFPEFAVREFGYFERHCEICGHELDHRLG